MSKKNSKKQSSGKGQRKTVAAQGRAGNAPASERLKLAKECVKLLHVKNLNKTEYEFLELRNQVIKNIPQMASGDPEYVYVVAELLYTETGERIMLCPSVEDLNRYTEEMATRIKNNSRAAVGNFMESDLLKKDLQNFYSPIKDIMSSPRKHNKEKDAVTSASYVVDKIMPTRSLKAMLIGLYDKAPSVYDDVRVQKELVEKHRARCRTSVNIDDFEKLVKVLIKAQTDEGVAKRVSNTILSIPFFLGDECVMLDCIWSMPKLYYAYRYAMELRAKFPDILEELDDETADSLMEKCREVLTETASEQFENCIRQSRAEQEMFFEHQKNHPPKPVEDKGTTKVRTASFKLDNDFYKGVLTAMEAMAADPCRLLESEEQVYYTGTDYIGEDAVTKLAQDFKQLCGKWEDDPTCCWKSFTGHGEYLGVIAEPGDNERVITPLAAITAHMTVWMVQFMQLSGEINVKDLMRNNHIKEKDVKHLVNSMFISYQRMHDKECPESLDEKMEFVGRLVSAYMIRILVMDRTHNVDLFYQMAEGKLEESIKNNSTLELEMLRESNQELLKETDELRTKISDIENDKETKTLKEEIRRLHNEIAELKQDVKDYSKEMSAISIERNGLEEMFNECSAQLEAALEKLGQYPEEEEYSEEAFRDIISKHNVLLWGVRAAALKEVKSKYPELDVCESTPIPVVRMERYDYLVCRVDFCSHGDFWATREAAARTKVPFRVLTKGMTAQKHLFKSVCEMDEIEKTKLSTTNFIGNRLDVAKQEEKTL